MKKALSLFLAVFLVAITVSQSSFVASADNKSMSVSFINCGQGDSILIQSKGKNMLVDAGKESHIDMLESYLDTCNIDQLDYAVATHFDEDHIGGMADIYNDYQVNNSVLTDFSKSSKIYESYINSVITEPDSIIVKACKNQCWTVGDAQVKVLYADSKASNCNDSSIVLRVDCGSNSLLLTGDISSKVEKKLVEAGAQLDVDVLKVAHHGSKTSSCDEFLSQVTPEYSVISVSEAETQNTYKHPSPETLLRLSNVGSKIYRTDKCGTVKMDFENDSITCTNISEDIESEIPSNSILRAKVNFSDNTYLYTGKAIKPSVTVSMNGVALKNENDVTVKTVYVTSSGKKYHYSSECSNMKSPKAIAKSDALSGGYTACSKCVVDVKPDYFVSYSNNVNVGTAVITITGNGAYCGTKEVEFEIVPCLHNYTTTKATLSKNGVIKCKTCGAVKSTIYYPKIITLSTTSYTYDGKAKKPTIKVTDSKGKTIAASNYTVTYSNNKNVGKATVKITFKGNYSGTKSLTFKINPKATSISSVSAQSKAFTVKWKKQATQTTGYEIQYSTDKNFKKGNKTVTVSKNSTTSKKITKLTGKKKYYVRIRTYKTVSGTKYYSAWSGVKNVTTKK